ncbi:F-box protein At5g39250-like [Cucurbita maxima]|uniref:F-box protein At5g39250-like n=1 Tax=Cucurbita maxima TaxID=3661 RepID=A0A6J1KS59_CUCMA|nr:F-box protein At5g39250-like [Cucurbita maxima]
MSWEILNLVFPLLDDVDLASCMAVSRQWRDAARDDYFWKCLCAKRWPSTYKTSNFPTGTYYKLYQNSYKCPQRRSLLSPRLSFDDLEFFIDIWSEGRLVFSKVVPGEVLQDGIKNPTPRTVNVLSYLLEAPGFKMTLAVEPGFSIPMCDTISVSVIVGYKDSSKVAQIVNKSIFDYVDQTSCRVFYYDYLDFPHLYPLVSGIRVCISFLFLGNGNGGVADVSGIVMDFSDVAHTKEEVLCLLDLLDWK